MNNNRLKNSRLKNTVKYLYSFKIATLLVIYIITFFTIESISQAAEKKWHKEPVLLDNVEIIPKSRLKANLNNKFFSEQYSFWMINEDGKSSRVQFLFSNHFGKKKGALNVKVNLNIPNKEKIKFNKEYKKGKWKNNKTELLIKAGSNNFYQLNNKYFIEFVDNDLTVKIELYSLHKSFKPSRKRLDFKKEGYYDTTILIPFGIFTAEITNKENQKTIIKGNAQAEHSISSAPPHIQALNWLEFRKLNTDSAILFKQFKTSKDHGKSYINYIVYADNKQNIIYSNKLKVNQDDFYIDKKSNSNYKIPFKVNIEAELKDKNIKIELTSGVLKKRKDLLGNLNYFVKKIVSFFSEPINYTISCMYKITAVSGLNTIHKSSGNGKYSIIHLNK